MKSVRLGVLGLFYSCSVLAIPLSQSPRVKIRKAVFQVEVARSDDEWRRGLMYREKLSPKEGMLFFGKIEREQAFWMKNTLVPLDIIFISKQNKIVSIAKKTKPLSEAPIPSGSKALHVLEILAGEADLNKIQVGDSVEFLNFK